MWREVTPQKHGNSSAFNAKVCFSVIQCTTSACRKTHAKNITIFLHTISYFIRQPNNTEKKANWIEIQDVFFNVLYRTLIPATHAKSICFESFGELVLRNRCLELKEGAMSRYIT